MPEFIVSLIEIAGERERKREEMARRANLQGFRHAPEFTADLRGGGGEGSPPAAARVWNSPPHTLGHCLDLVSLEIGKKLTTEY